MEQGIEVVANNGMVFITIHGEEITRIGLHPEQAVDLSAAIDSAIEKAVMPKDVEGVPV